MTQPGTLADQTCTICHGNTHARYLWHGFQVFSCTGCGLESVSPIPTEDELKNYYEKIFYQPDNDIKVVRWEMKMKLVDYAFEQYLVRYRRFSGGRSPQTFVDIGGGFGFYARAAKNRGVHSCLMDYGSTALEFAHDKLGVTWTIQGDVEKCSVYLEHNYFDFVLARHVIEHMRNPTEFVVNLKKILRVGGLVQVETPNTVTWEQLAHPRQIANHFEILRKSNPAISIVSTLRLAVQKSMSGINPPKHIWGFTQQSLMHLFKNNGFEILDVKRPIFGSRIFDPLYYEIHRLTDRVGLGIPYYFFERLLSPLAAGNGANLVVLARRVH